MNIATFRATAGQIATALGDGWDARRAISEAHLGNTPDVLTTTLHGPGEITLTLRVTSTIPGRWWIIGRLTRDEQTYKKSIDPEGPQPPTDLVVDDDLNDHTNHSDRADLNDRPAGRCSPDHASPAGRDAPALPSGDTERAADQTAEQITAKQIASEIQSRYLPAWTAYLDAVREEVNRVAEAMRIRKARKVALGDQVIAVIGNDRATWKRARNAPANDPYGDTIAFKLGDRVIGWLTIDDPGIDDQATRSRTEMVLRCPADLALAVVDFLTRHAPR